jgi:hypothetical protein
MNKFLSILLTTFCIATAAHAQGGIGVVTMSTDPAKAAAIERHAQELQAHSTPAAHKLGERSMKHKAIHHVKSKPKHA